MKYKITLFGVFLCSIALLPSFAQNPIQSHSYVVGKYYSVIQDEIVPLYHMDSSENAVDMSDYEIFFGTGTYESSKGEIKADGEYEIEGDSLFIDGEGQFIVEISDNLITTRMQSLELVDLEGTLDTAYHYLHLYHKNLAFTEAERAQLNQVTFFPNPASDMLNIRTTGDVRIGSIDIFSAKGEKVGSHMVDSNNGDTVISVDRLTKGVYFVHLFDQNQQQVVVERFIKQ
ncbi:T9SS type A sorting domain-containing protein [Cytophagaceae bacterium ABcell3]|nr:T9SS type A sorting domain-containing protein [Cytophagaceae bacterium ABcell3]